MESAVAAAKRPPRGRPKEATSTEGNVDALQRVLWGALIVSFPFTDLSFSPERMKSFGQPAVFLALLLGVLALADAARGRVFVPKGRSAVLLALFLATVGMSFFVNYPINPYMWPGHSPWAKSAKQLSQWLVDGSVVYFTLRFVRTWKDFRFALQCWFIAFLLSAGSAVLQVAASFSPLGLTNTLVSVLHNGGMQHSGRLDLLAFEPGMAGDYLLEITPLLVCGAYYWKGRGWRVFWSAVALVLFCGTFSLGCFGALFVAALVVGVVYARRGSKGLLLAVCVLLVVLVGAAVSSSKGEEFVGDRVADILQNGLGPSIPEFSARARLAGAEGAFNIFLEHPLTGVGVGKSPFYMYEAYPDWALSQGDVATSAFGSDSPAGAISFNLFIQTLAEMGIIGGALLVALLVSMLADCYSALNGAQEKWKRRAFAAILFALVAQIVHYNAMSWLDMRYWFFIWGLAICARQLVNQKDPRLPARPPAFERPPFTRVMRKELLRGEARRRVVREEAHTSIPDSRSAGEANQDRERC